MAEDNAALVLDSVEFTTMLKREVLFAPAMHIVIENRVDELSKLVVFIGRFAADERLSAALLHDLNLVLEELLVNVIMYGGDVQVNPIRVEIARRDDAVIATIADSAAPFNPLEYDGYGVRKTPMENRGVAAWGFGSCVDCPTKSPMSGRKAKTLRPSRCERTAKTARCRLVDCPRR